MVTVISSKEKSTTPVSNGVAGGSSCDNERPFQFIKDYQEVREIIFFVFLYQSNDYLGGFSSNTIV